GLTVSGYAVLLIALLTRSLPFGIFTFSVPAAMAIIWRWRRDPPVKEKISGALAGMLRSPAAWAVAGIAGLVGALELQVLLPDEVFVRAIFVGWGDAAYHLSIIQRLAVAQPFTLEHPVFAGHALTYPFLVDFLSAVYRRLGASALFSYHLPVVVLAVAGVALLFSWYRALRVRHGLAVMLLLLALFGAGLGWLWLGSDVAAAWQSGGMAAVGETLRDLPHEYTHLDRRTSGLRSGTEGDANIVWMVPVLSFLTHQRGFILGLGLGLVVLYALVTRASAPWVVGVLAGLLPLAHGHTFFALGLVSVAWFLVGWPNRRFWLRAFLPAAIIALPALLYLRAGLSGSGGSAAMRWWFGWMTCTHERHWFICDQPIPAGVDTSVLWFWLKNFGGVLVAWAAVLLAAAAQRWRKRERTSTSAAPLLLPAVLLFAVPNLVRLQPWEFDNNKVLFWWWLFAIGAIGQHLMRSSRPSFRRWALVVLSVVVLPAGITDIASRLGHWSTYHSGYVQAADRAAADWIVQQTVPNAVIAGVPNAHSLVPLLTGRPLALGYEGWLWSQGINLGPRVEAISALARGEQAAACREGIAWVVADAEFFQRFGGEEAALAIAAQLRWQQETPRGARRIYALSCTPQH
ncbi:MAG: hypothetical protein Q7S23_03715, partial [bacterium]|nr:hypothetical protein [bacterium]